MVGPMPGCILEVKLLESTRFEFELTEYIGRLAADQIKRHKMVIAPGEISASYNINNDISIEKKNISIFF